MFTVPEEVSAQQAANVEQGMKFAETAVAAVEQLFDLNVKTARAGSAELLGQLRAFAGVKDIQEFTALQSGIAQSGSEKTMGYARAVFGWVSESQAQFSKLVEAQVGVVNRHLTTSLDKAAKSAPSGSEFAFAAAKNALSAANQAYDALSKAGKQVIDVTEATVSAAAPVKAVAKKVA